MHRRGHAGRVDRNHAVIVEALRAIGASVTSLASVGDGCPDLLVGIAGRSLLMEVKADGGRLRPAQETWMKDWRGAPVVVVRSIDDAISAAQLARALGPER